MQRVRGTERRARRAIRPDPGPDRTRECPGESADSRMVVRSCETGYGERNSAATIVTNIG